MSTMKLLESGVWPTMITPFNLDGSIDYEILVKLIDWYINQGVTGLFAVCQSSEMFSLSLRERQELAGACVRYADGRIPVIASGHVAENLNDQIEESKMMIDAGIDAYVLLTNRFCREGEEDEVFKSRLDILLKALPETIPLGFYECPAPYKRILSSEMLRFCLETERFSFLKDTSCDLDDIKRKLEIMKGTSFKLFNANAATLLNSLQLGAAGYSGVMTNFHPGLYVWLNKNWESMPERAEDLQAFLGLASLVERQLYPVNAMYNMQLNGVPFELMSRRVDVSGFTQSMKLEIKQLKSVTDQVCRSYGVSNS